MYANEHLSFLLQRLSQQLETIQACPRTNALQRRSTIVQMCQRFVACYDVMASMGVARQHSRTTDLTLLAPIWIALLRLLSQSHAGWPADRTLKTIFTWKLEEGASRSKADDPQRAAHRLIRTLQLHPSELGGVFRAFFNLLDALGLQLDQLNEYAGDRLGFKGRLRARTDTAMRTWPSTFAA